MYNNHFQGAYILDSLMSYNASENSQSLPPDYHKRTPKAVEDIEGSGMKGDFLGIYAREFDSDLSARFK